MKKLNYLLLFVFILGLGVFSGCGNDDNPETPLQKRVNELAKSWQTGAVTDESIPEEEVAGFEDFTINFSSGTITGEEATGSYTSSGDNSSVEALPTSSNFTINSTSLNKVVLDNGTEITIITISDSQLTFSVPGTNIKSNETTFTYDLVPVN